LIKAKIRGIYSTALTKLLLENGDFEIVQPSFAIKKRFGISDNSAPPEMKIKDRYDLQGVRVLGNLKAVNTFRSALHSAFKDALTRKWAMSIDGIYKGKPVESDENMIHVDLGSDVIGKLPKHESAAVNDKPLLVQVERRITSVKQPNLTTNLKIIGGYAILAQNSKVGVSFRIHDVKKRVELYALGKSLAPESWGIIWREASANQPIEALKNEITMLEEKVNILSEEATRAEAPALLIEGLYIMDVEFPCFSKGNLDRLRASATPTLDGHHFYKSCRGTVSSALEMAEGLLDKGQERSKVEESFKEQILHDFPVEGSLVDVEHVKLSGAIFHLGQAAIEDISEEQIRYSRIMLRNGFYDGLGVKKEEGDKAVSETKMGEWSITTKYFANNGEWKGTYVNLNTPVQYGMWI
jgi:Ribonuclease G/E